MVNLVEEINKYLGLGKPLRPKQRPLEFEFVGETFANDQWISELTAPEVVIYIPIGFIRKYNLATIGRNSEALPDADELWKFLHPHLIGKGLVAKNEFVVSVDDTLKELLEWPHGARFKNAYSRKGVILEVKADYDPYWDENSDWDENCDGF